MHHLGPFLRLKGSTRIPIDMAPGYWRQQSPKPQTPTELMPTLEPAFDMSSEASQADKSSLLYVMLPKMVKSRIRRIPSLRRSISTIGQFPLADDPGPLSPRSSEEFDSGFHTPPPQYRSRMSVALADHSSDSDSLEDLEDDTPHAEPAAPSYFDNFRFGINWKFASQGS